MVTITDTPPPNFGRSTKFHNSKKYVAGTMLGPDDVHNLIPRTRGFMRLWGKKKLKFQMKSSLLISFPEMRRVSWICQVGIV
jgi:hypothetical protein